jgi:uroporphyrinogen III methyltransferase/synthase
MVTRPKHQAAALAEPLKELGAKVLIEPVIEILPPEDWADLDRAVKNVAEGRISTLVFVSVNGVHAFLDRMAQTAQAVKLSTVMVIGIGKSTCQALENRQIQARSVPGKSDSNRVANYLIDHQAKGEILIVRADRGSRVLPDRLKAAKIDFKQVAAYRSVDRASVEEASVQAMHSGEIAWVTVTSSAIGNSLVRLFGDALKHTKLVTISPTTSKTLRELGLEPAAEASEYNMSGIVNAIVASENRL